jgi:hypothetical protein
MIRTYAFMQPAEKPSDAQATLQAILVDAGVTGFNVVLQRVDVAGYAFAIDAEDAGENLSLLQMLCGSLNTVAAQGAPVLAAQAVRVGWQVAGSEGRFAAEHPPPRDSA